jgi:hypothetical protein
MSPDIHARLRDRRMKLATTLELFAYWNRARAGKLAPDRADIDPGAIRRALGDTFILAFERPNGHRFRLAGTRVCALFGQELKGQSFLTLWGQRPSSSACSIRTLWKKASPAGKRRNAPDPTNRHQLRQISAATHACCERKRG